MKVAVDRILLLGTLRGSMYSGHWFAAIRFGMSAVAYGLADWSRASTDLVDLVFWAMRKGPKHHKDLNLH